MLYGSAIATQFLETFKEFPPRQEPASFTIDHAVEELQQVPVVSRRAERGGTQLPGPTVPRSRRSSTSWGGSAPRAARITSRPKTASPSSTTTARCGARSRCYIQLDFIVRRLAEKAAADPSLRDQQPYKAAYERRPEWFGAAITKHYQGDDADLKVLDGRGHVAASSR